MNIHNIIKLAFAIKREFNVQLEQYGLTFNQWLILKELNLAGPMPAAKLAQSLGSDKATMSQCLKALENKDFIARVNNPEDKRSKIIEIQDSAREYCQQIKGIECTFKERLNIEFTEEEVSLFNMICEHNLHALEGEK